MIEAKPQLHHGIETTYPFLPQQNYFQLRGWAFVGGSGVACRSRLVIGGKNFPPREVMARPDVTALFPLDADSAENCGFRFLVYLPFGLHRGSLEVSAAEGSWLTVRNFLIPVSSHPLLGAVEYPSAAEVIRKPVRIEGWCFHPEFKVTEVVLQFGNVEVPCQYGIERPDVAARFPDCPAARHSGFITNEDLPRGTGRVKIRALTECGRVYFNSAEHNVEIHGGWIPNPPPASPLPTISIPALAPPERSEVQPAPAAGRNLLFVLYGDFSANSALHVASLANEFVALGYDCVVAVPENKQTVVMLPRCEFKVVDFADSPRLLDFYRNGRNPDLIHAWTTRENVRQFTAEMARRIGCPYLVHLEDNEREILESRLQRSYAELSRMPDAELEPLIPATLSHPRRATAFLQLSAGATVIVDRLRDMLPSRTQAHLLWPAADPRIFKPRPRDDALRSRLGYEPEDIVLFYHGNTHTSNALEVEQLYLAVALLNEQGLRTHLIRTGRDFPGFRANEDVRIASHILHVGHVSRSKHLPSLMALADFFVQPGLPGAFNDYRFPSKLPEFFSLGRPVILPATNLGRLVEHGRDAWVLPQADAPGIASAIAHLHRQPELVRKLSDGAVGFSRQHFSWNRSARELLEFYRSLTPLA